jgi:hypothetical protein
LRKIEHPTAIRAGYSHPLEPASGTYANQSSNPFRVSHKSKAVRLRIRTGGKMPTREEALAERTYKEDGIDVEKRVFYTLHGEGKMPQREESQNHRNSKAIALLFKMLLDKRLLNEEQLDEILLEVTG